MNGAWLKMSYLIADSDTLDVVSPISLDSIDDDVLLALVRCVIVRREVVDAQIDSEVDLGLLDRLELQPSDKVSLPARGHTSIFN